MGRLTASARINQTRGLVPSSTAPRAVVQMDTVAFGVVLAITGLDIYTKEADVVLRSGDCVLKPLKIFSRKLRQFRRSATLKRKAH